MRVALAQINPTVGDFTGNARLIVRSARETADRGANVVVFPELALTGYPPRDLVEKPSFLTRNETDLEGLARETADLDLSLIVGFVGRSKAETGKRALNSAAVIRAAGSNSGETRCCRAPTTSSTKPAISAPPNAPNCARWPGKTSP